MAIDDDVLELPAGPDDWWTAHRGASPVLATALHDGHGVPPALAARMALSDADRRREEDPFTAFAIRDVPNRIVVHRSRFALDLNRAREGAVYLSPEQAWGLRVWNEPPDAGLLAETLAMHDHYYGMLRTTLAQLEAQYGRFVVLDLHSYNHRRDGPDAPPAPAEGMPQINIGTFSMDRARWAPVVDAFIEHVRGFAFQGTPLDVRENIAFQGRGEQARFVHHEFPQSGCAIAVEFKKFFMDEWTGRPDRAALVALRAMIRSSLPVLEAALGARA